MSLRAELLTPRSADSKQEAKTPQTENKESQTDATLNEKQQVKKIISELKLSDRGAYDSSLIKKDNEQFTIQAAKQYLNNLIARIESNKQEALGLTASSDSGMIASIGASLVSVSCCIMGNPAATPTCLGAIGLWLATINHCCSGRHFMELSHKDLEEIRNTLIKLESLERKLALATASPATNPATLFSGLSVARTPAQYEGVRFTPRF